MEEGALKAVPLPIKCLFGFLYPRALRTGSRALSLECGSLLDVILRAEVLTDTNGTIVWRAENAAFDRRRIITDTIGGLNVGFPGQYFDSESGL